MNYELLNSIVEFIEENLTENIRYKNLRSS